MNRSIFPFAIPLLAGCLCLAGCFSDEPPAPAQSEMAAKVSELLDREAYSAAKGILDAKLPDHPDDAGLHVQYVRYLILNRELPRPGFEYSPLFEDGEKYYATYLARESGQRAVQLDPSIKAHFAWVVLSALRDRIDQRLEEGHGIVGQAGWDERMSGVAFNGFDQCMIQVAWVALEASPETAAAFADDYRALMEKSIELGKVCSSSMLGNLVGDMEQGGQQGERDFDVACDAWLRALANYEDDPNGDWVKENIAIFKHLYGNLELPKARAGQGPESFNKLEKELQTRGYTLMEKKPEEGGS